MLNSETDIMCGIFDSTVNTRNRTRSEPRTVKYYEFEFFTEASGCSHVDDRTYPIHRGMLLSTHPGQRRYSNLPIRCYYIRLVALDSDEAQILSSFPEVTTIQEADINKISALFLKLGTSLIGNTEKELRDLRVNSVFWELIYRCKRATAHLPLSVSKSSGTVTVMKAKEFIDDHFREDCSLSRIAEHVHISPNYLHTLFSEKMNMTPLEYVLRKRIDAAKQMIMAESASLLEIALELGFSSQSHLNKVFKARTGMTPMEFRRRLISEY